MSARDETYAEHAERARRGVRAVGLADCVHYAPDYAARVDALARVRDASGLGEWSTWRVGLLADGRMVIAASRAWTAEIVDGK